jgi:alpha-methylacyl-CoA racemase
MLLADLGADVVRVDRTEASGLGVPMAPRTTSTPQPPLGGAGPEVRPPGVDAVLRLIDGADVLIEGFRPAWPSAWAWARPTVWRATRAWSTAA